MLGYNIFVKFFSLSNLSVWQTSIFTRLTSMTMRNYGECTCVGRFMSNFLYVIGVKSSHVHRRCLASCHSLDHPRKWSSQQKETAKYREEKFNFVSGGRRSFHRAFEHIIVICCCNLFRLYCCFFLPSRRYCCCSLHKFVTSRMDGRLREK